MDSKRLTFSSNIKPALLTPAQSEIEVPAGESYFHIAHKTLKPVHYIFHLRHPSSSVLITGIVLAGKNQIPSLTTEVVHHSPETRAEILIRTLAKDQAAPRYQGLIRIEKGAFNCESYLNHHSLLLGNEAKSWSLPSLEILNDQVKCSHAATVRTITPSDLFYLQSRGISAQQAEDVLVKAFLHF